jgi:hypothetical protein
MIIIIKNKEDLDEDFVKDNYEYLYDGLKTKKLSTSLFNIVFLLRRIYTVVILVFLGDYPYLQCMLLMLGAYIDLVKQVNLRPYIEE